ncbi:hypothetical protein PR048_027752 [Dryococelus australis]|uniref:Uncharacterized protein n=1 Tax=Dryococelus australis TaxID=614101 RepID=A0ABQ9GHE4_9NEOP|nr:hypothetical protein PR048_027752 [Dryococelus australis]
MCFFRRSHVEKESAPKDISEIDPKNIICWKTFLVHEGKADNTAVISVFGNASMYPRKKMKMELGDQTWLYRKLVGTTGDMHIPGHVELFFNLCENGQQEARPDSSYSTGADLLPLPLTLTSLTTAAREVGSSRLAVPLRIKVLLYICDGFGYSRANGSYSSVVDFFSNGADSIIILFRHDIDSVVDFFGWAAYISSIGIGIATQANSIKTSMDVLGDAMVLPSLSENVHVDSMAIRRRYREEHVATVERSSVKAVMHSYDSHVKQCKTHARKPVHVLGKPNANGFLSEGIGVQGHAEIFDCCESDSFVERYEIEKQGPLKYIIWLECVYTKPEPNQDEHCRRAFKTQNVSLCNVYDIEKSVDDNIKKLCCEEEEMMMKGSSWTLDSVDHLQLRTSAWTTVALESSPLCMELAKLWNVSVTLRKRDPILPEVNSKYDEQFLADRMTADSYTNIGIFPGCWSDVERRRALHYSVVFFSRRERGCDTIKYHQNILALSLNLSESPEGERKGCDTIKYHRSQLLTGFPGGE